MIKRWLLTIKRSFVDDTAQAITSCFIVVMFGLFPCFFGVNGYANITWSKYLFLLVASGLYFFSLLIWWLVRIRRQEIRLSLCSLPGLWQKLSPVQRLLLGYALLMVLSALASPYPYLVWWGEGRYEGLLTMLIYLAIFIAVSSFGRFKSWYLYVLLIPVCLNIILSLLQLHGGNPLSLYPNNYDYFDGNVLYSGQFLGTIGNTGLLSAFLCLVIPAFICYFIRQHTDRRSYALLAAAVIAAIIMFRSGVAAGLVALAVGILVILPLFLPSRRARWIYVILIIILLAALLLWLWQYEGDHVGLVGEAAAFVQGKADDSLGSGRIAIWKETLQLIQDRPILGGGPDTIGERLDLYFTREVDGIPTGYRTKVDMAHNDYLNIAANTGIPSLVLYVLALGISFVSWLQTSRDVAVLICGAAVLCYCVQIFFSFSLCITAPLFWIFWGLLEQSLRQKKNAR